MAKAARKVHSYSQLAQRSNSPGSNDSIADWGRSINRGRAPTLRTTDMRRCTPHQHIKRGFAFASVKLLNEGGAVQSRRRCIASPQTGPSFNDNTREEIHQYAGSYYSKVEWFRSEDSRTSSGRLHSPQRRRSWSRTRIEMPSRLFPWLLVEASSKQTPTDSPGDPPNSSVDFGRWSHEEPACRPSKNLKMYRTDGQGFRQTEASARRFTRLPKHSDSVEAEDSHTDSKGSEELFRCSPLRAMAASISTEQTSKESRRDTNQIAKPFTLNRAGA
jgi:hypothetical protein